MCIIKVSALVKTMDLTRLNKRAASKRHCSHIFVYVKTSSKFLDGMKGLHQIKKIK